MWGCPHPLIFFETPPIKTDAPMGHVQPPLKNEAPASEKHPPPPVPCPPLKHEASFHEMIPRKSTINNLKSS